VLIALLDAVMPRFSASFSHPRPRERCWAALRHIERRVFGGTAPLVATGLISAGYVMDPHST
jgi:hypothetical protein